MISYIDTGICNLGSLRRAFEHLGVALNPIRHPSDFEAARAIILPGVGAFSDGMAGLRDQGLIVPLRQAAERGKPLFGICLGMQLMFGSSEEYGYQEGLGLIQGTVQRLDPGGNRRYRVPNIGWCDVAPTRPSSLFPAAVARCCYFVHSYYAAPAAFEIVSATIDFAGRPTPVAVEQGNLFGVQFHPEKSQDDGLAVLVAFVDHLQRSGRLA
jgi:imidazole glycerol-phosphate synthase subunit HisH